MNFVSDRTVITNDKEKFFSFSRYALTMCEKEEMRIPLQRMPAHWQVSDTTRARRRLLRHVPRAFHSAGAIRAGFVGAKRPFNPFPAGWLPGAVLGVHKPDSVPDKGEARRCRDR